MLERIGEMQDRLVAEAKSIMALAEAEGRPLTDEETRQVDDTTAEFDRLDRQRAVAQRFAAAVEGGNRRTAAVEVGGRGDAGRWGSPGFRLREGSAFRAMFGPPTGEMAGFRDAQDWFQAALSGRYDQRLIQAAGGHRTDVAESAGVFMPMPIVAGLLDATVEASTVFSRVRRVPVPAKNVTFPLWRDTDRSAGLLAGFAVEWLPEGGEGTIQTGKATQLTVNCNKLGIFSKATHELVADSPLFVSEFQPALARAAAYGFDRALVRGTGVGQPLGLLNDPAGIVVPKVAGQAADTIVFDNLVNMFAAMYPAGAKRAVWLAHPTCLPALLRMSRFITNVAGTENVGGEAVVQPSEAGDLRLLGLPVAFSEHMNPLGDQGDIVLADLSQYAAFVRDTVRLETSREAFWMTDEIGFRLLWRATGQGLWSEIGRRPGVAGGTESWLVLLAERA